GMGAPTNSWAATEGTAPWAELASRNSMYGPAGATALFGGSARVTVPAVRLTTGRITVRWAPSVRWVTAVFRTSTAWAMRAASGVGTVMVRPHPIDRGAAVIVGLGPRNRYGGLKISNDGSRWFGANGPGRSMFVVYSVGIGAWPPTSTRPSGSSTPVLW